MLHLSARNIDGGPGTLSIDNPVWDDVEKAVRRMNGRQFCEVDLGVDGENSLLVTGGARGRYMVEHLSPVQNLVLYSPHKSDTRQVAIMENGPEDFPECVVVELPVVLQAAQTYLETHEVDRRFCWKE